MFSIFCFYTSRALAQGPGELTGHIYSIASVVAVNLGEIGAKKTQLFGIEERYLQVRVIVDPDHGSNR